MSTPHSRQRGVDDIRTHRSKSRSSSQSSTAATRGLASLSTSTGPRNQESGNHLRMLRLTALEQEQRTYQREEELLERRLAALRDRIDQLRQERKELAHAVVGELAPVRRPALAADSATQPQVEPSAVPRRLRY